MPSSGDLDLLLLNPESKDLLLTGGDLVLLAEYEGLGVMTGSSPDGECRGELAAEATRKLALLLLSSLGSL